MMDVLSSVFVAVMIVTIAAALIYIGGFLISMVAAFFASIADAATDHHTHPLLG